MDQIKHQNLQTGTDPIKKSQFLKKTLKFLFSVISIFSFTLSYSSWFPIGVNGYLSVFSFHLLNYTIERKYMFLLCNGILVFLARNFDLFSSTDLQDRLLDIRNVDQYWSKPTEFSEMVNYAVEKETVVERVGSFKNLPENEYEDGEEVKEGQREEKQEQAVESEIFIFEEDNKEEKKRISVQEGGGGQDQEEEQQEEEEDDGSLSTEELNKKFEEFIIKMKEGIRIEAQAAQQQLVFV